MQKLKKKKLGMDLLTVGIILREDGGQKGQTCDNIRMHVQIAKTQAN